MTTNTIRRTALAALTTLLCWPAAALAQGECGDTTCDEGFTCNTYESECPAVDCAEGEDCASCEPEEYSYCERAACESDDECGDFMVCGTLTNYECPVAPPCAENEPCEDTSADCTEVEVQQCAPKWELPCEADADCGEGFTCTPAECGCAAGSEGAAAGSAETDPAVTKGTDAETRPATDLVAPDSGDCGCPEEVTNYCVQNEIECGSADDCPADWTCDESFRGGACAVSSDGESTCEDPISVNLCQPPYDKVWPDGGILAATSGPAADGGGVAESGVATDAEETRADSNVTPPQTTSVTPDSTDGAQTGAASGDDVTTAEPTTPSMNGGSAMSAKGCAVAPSQSAGSRGLLWSALGFGLLLGLRRRR